MLITAHSLTKGLTGPWTRSCGVSTVVHAGLLVGLGMLSLGGAVGERADHQQLLAEWIEPPPPVPHAALTLSSAATQPARGQADGGGGAPGDGPGRGGAVTVMT